MDSERDTSPMWYHINEVNAKVGGLETRTTKLEVRTDYHAEHLDRLMEALDRHVREEREFQASIIERFDSLMKQFVQFKFLVLGAGATVGVIWGMAKTGFDVFKFFHGA